MKLGGVRLFAVAAALLSGAASFAQAPTAKASFDIISIHLSDPTLETENLNFGQRGVSGQGVTLPFLIQEAYHIHDFQIEGLSEKLASAKYDFQAKMDDPSADKSGDNGTPEERRAFEELTRQRLQSLLATRFNLQLHPVTEEKSVLALTVSPEGSRLVSTQHPRGGFIHNQDGEHSRETSCENVSMAEFAEDLGVLAHHVVLNRTDLTGRYDFTVKYALEDDSDPVVAALPAALREQLGLVFKPAKGMVTVYHVDHAEAPSPN